LPIKYKCKYIKIGNTAVFYAEWYDKGIYFINDLVKEDLSFLT